MSSTSTRPVAVLAVSDSDSYLKWSLATLGRMPSHWRTSQVIIDSPLRPSAAQTDATSPVLDRAAVLRRIRAEQPDVVLLACSGPVVAALTSVRELRDPHRPVVLTGLPGISYPVRPRAIEHRAGCDLMLLHSHREITAFTEAAAAAGSSLTFALATLPFLQSRSTACGPPRTEPGTTLFAAQAEVPEARANREAILLALADCPRPVVKLRAAAGEQQTHRETWSYPRLAAELGLAGGGIEFRHGPLREALRDAAGLVTVSSTAALEAIAAGVPILILTDFGLDDRSINLVFADSGCLGTVTDLRAGRFSWPDPAWRMQNYFHPPADDDWLDLLAALISRRRAGSLPVPVRNRSPLSWTVRGRVRLLAPVPAAARWWYGRRARRNERRAPDRTVPAPPPARRAE